MRQEAAEKHRLREYQRQNIEKEENLTNGLQAKNEQDDLVTSCIPLNPDLEMAAQGKQEEEKEESKMEIATAGFLLYLDQNQQFEEVGDLEEAAEPAKNEVSEDLEEKASRNSVAQPTEEEADSS